MFLRRRSKTEGVKYDRGDCGRVGATSALGSTARLVVMLASAWVVGVYPVGPFIGQRIEYALASGGPPPDEDGKFVAAILADTEDTWASLFKQMGKTYEYPTLVLFKESTTSRCGLARAGVEPFYCRADHKIYIDLDIYRELRTQFRGPGDVYLAFVIAREVGHHVQNLLGTPSKVDAQRQSSGDVDARALSVRLELQADCFAGVWAHRANKEGILDVIDIAPLLTGATALLENQSRGYAMPNGFPHGTVEQRSNWFKKGYSQGVLTACDTFSGPI